MKRFISTCCALVCSCVLFAQWSYDEVYQANTAATASQLTQEEKKLVAYINLVRLYPQKFLGYVVREYERPQPFSMVDRSTNYYSSLVSTLSRMSPVAALPFDLDMYSYANCWAVEMGRLGKVGHNRVNCADGYFSECCDYGFDRAVDIVFALLLDENVESLGHRKNLLDGRPHCIGVKISSHNSNFNYCSVIDCGYNYPTRSSNYKSKDHSIALCQEINMELGFTASYENYDNSVGSDASITAEILYLNNYTPIVDSPIPDHDKTSVVKKNDKPKQNARHMFYDYSGTKFLSILNANYTYDINDNFHIVSLGVVGYRYKMFAFSFLDFEMGVYPLSKSFGWKPSMELYIPVSKSFSVNIHVGTSVDITYLGQYMVKNYTYDENNFYVDGVVGLSVFHSGCKYVPLKFFAEYRYPFVGTVHQNGFYVGFQMLFGANL